MTFSLVGRCPRTGMLGAAVTTSALAVGSRCPYAEAGIGASLTQNRTDPRLGPLLLEMIRRGFTALCPSFLSNLARKLERTHHARH